MADANRDGELSKREFAIAMHLGTYAARNGLPLPRVLPSYLLGGPTDGDDIAKAALAGEEKQLQISSGVPKGSTEAAAMLLDGHNQTSETSDPDKKTSKQSQGLPDNEPTEARAHVSEGHGSHAVHEKVRSNSASMDKGDKIATGDKDENAAAYGMSDQEKARYNTAFDRLLADNETPGGSLSRKQAPLLSYYCFCILGYLKINDFFYLRMNNISLAAPMY